MVERDIEARITQALRRFDSIDPPGGGLAGLTLVRDRAARGPRAAHPRAIAVAVAVGVLAVALPAAAATGMLDPVANAFRQLGVSTPGGAPAGYALVGQQPLANRGTARLYVPGAAAVQRQKGGDCAYLEFLDAAGHHQGGTGWCAGSTSAVQANTSGTITALHLPDPAVTRASVFNGDRTVTVAVARGYCLLPAGFTSDTLVITGTSATGAAIGPWTVHIR